MPSKGGVIGIILTGLALVGLALAVWFTWQGATAVEIQQAVLSPDADPSTVPDQVSVPIGTNLVTFGLGLLCFALLGLVLYLAYQTRRFFALRYSLDRNAITINLGDRRQVIPLANIRHVVPAETVIGQMRSQVYSPAEAQTESSEPAGRPVTKAYPRTRPVVQAEPGPGVSEGEISEIDTETDTRLQDPSEADFEEDASGPAYQMTQTAAADSSLEDLEGVEFQPAVNHEDVDAADIEEADFQPLEVSDEPSRAIEPARVRSLAVDFDELPPPRNSASADGGNRPDQGAAFATSGSVNFQVKAPLLSNWPGFYLNRANVASLGPVQFYSTRPLTSTLLVRTARQTYAISPRDPQQFVREFNLRRKLGAIETVEEGVLPGPFLSHPLWHDRLGRGLIVAGVVLNLILYLYLIVRFNDLQASLRIHFDKFGKPDKIGSRDELMLLPFIGLLAVIGNSILGAFIHPKDRIPAYLLYGAAILLQILTAVAVLVILAVSGS